MWGSGSVILPVWRAGPQYRAPGGRQRRVRPGLRDRGGASDFSHGLNTCVILGDDAKITRAHDDSGVAVELLVPRGSAFGYLGPNGAGKTTLIRTLLGLTLANAGTMSLLGTPVPAGGQGALGFPPMPTWAMISVIAGWIVGWSGIGAWRMMTRDA